MTLLKVAAAALHPESLYVLGRLYADRSIPTRDENIRLLLAEKFVISFVYLQLCSMAWNYDSSFFFSCCLDAWHFVLFFFFPFSSSLSGRYLSQASEYDVIDAHFDLARLFSTGESGFHRDSSKADKYLRRCPSSRQMLHICEMAESVHPYLLASRKNSIQTASYISFRFLSILYLSFMFFVLLIALG